MAATNKTRVSFVCMVMLSLAATLGMSVAAHGQAHGIGISHFCDGPKLVGETLDCTVQVIHNDDFGDTLSINESWVIVDPGGLDVRVPAVGNLEIIAVVGNTTAIVGGSLPVLIGPPGSTLSGLPGDPSPGVVTFAVNTYVIQPGDPDPLPTMANVVIMDLCDDPDTQGCSLIPNQVQFLAATDIIAPEISLSMDWEPFSVCQGGTTPVTYSYTVDNSGDVDLQNVLVDHDQCGPVQLVGGDNGNGILETTETWIFECTASLGVAVLSTVDVTADVVGGGPSVFDDDQFSVGTFPLGLELEESFTICEGDSAFICATPIGNPPFQWSWTGPAGFSASTQCIDVDEPGIYTVDITSNGCFVQGATEVILEPAPPCDITGPLEVCEFDDEIAYQAPPGAVNYAWSISGNGEFLFVGEGPFVTVDALGAGSFLLEVTVTDDAGCQSTCQLEVIVNPNPPCTIDGPAEACELGSTVEYSAPAGLATYAWSVNGDGFIVGPNDQQTLLVSPGSSGSFTVSLAVTDENGCFSQCNVLVPIVFCQPDIAVTKTVSDSEPFEGDEIVYTVTATNVGQESASTVDLEDVLPAGVTFVGVDFISQGTYGEIGGTWSIGSVGTGTTETLEIRVSVDPGTAGTTGTGDFIDTFVPAGSGGLSGPLGLTFGPDRNLYVSSIGTNEVLRYDDLTGNFIDAFVTAGSGGLASPVGLAFGPDGNLYVASQGTNEVLRYHGITGLFIDAFVPAGSGGLSSPVGLAFGPDGDLYVAAQATNEVYRYDGNSGAFVGVFVTAGSGGLVSPFGVRFGPDGNLYVASEGTDEILRYDGGTGAFIDAIVTAGSGGLTTPEGLTFGPDGNLYVSSEGTSSILRYDGGTGAFIDTYVLSFSGGLIFPQDLIFGPDGQLYVASITTTGEIRRYVGFITNVAFLQEIAPSDSNALNNRDSAGIDVQAVTSADLIVSKFVNNDTPGEGDQIVYTVAVFNNGPDDATGVTVDDALPAGVTFVQVDSVTQGSYDEVLGAWDVGALPNGVAAVLEIRVTVDAGTAETTGTGEFIDLFASGLDTPAGVVFDNEGNLYVSSQEGDTIYAFDSTGTPLPLVTGLELDGGAGLTIGPDGHLYACSYDNGQVVRYDVDAGAFIDVFTSGFALANPLDVVFGPDGNVYVAALGYIARYDGATGVFIDQFVPSVSIPHGLKFGPDGNLYVAKWSPGEIVRYDGTTGAFIDVFSTDGLDLPTDLQFGPDGNLYVADLTTNGVNRYDGLTGALIDTFVPSLSGGLNSPTDVAFGPDGNLYVPGLNSQVHRYQGFITNVATISAFNETDPDLLDNQASVGITVRASGACCTSGGVCQVVSENTCSNLEGVYQGDGTTCEPFPCPVKCCLPDGSCIDIHSSDCFLAGGQSEPPGSSCFSDGGPCPPVGGCCLDNDTCENLTQFGCDAVDGYYQGDDLFCGYEPCVGACCLEPSGGCQNDTPVNCAYAGGTFQGFDINCSEIVCPGEFGACCIGDFCTGTTQFDCELQGGFFAGFGTNCASDPCPRRCCLSDGSCLDTDSSDCLAQGGEPGPLGSVCDGESCGSPGACCLAGTDCQVIAEFACDAMGGVFEGGEGCGSFTCSGACCTNGGFCEVLTFFECTEYVAGLYQGNNTTCVSDPCFEACCLEGGECQDLLPADCMAMSGTPQGLGVTCATEPCPVFGACCFQTATCQDLFEDACAAAEGFFQGADTFCIDDPCPPNGACCLLDLTCIFTLAEDCAQQAGVFQGAGTVCDAGACPEPGGVLAEGKISQSSGGFGGILTDFGDFGRAFAGLGDLDGDGPSVGCVAIGAPAPPIPGDGSLFIEGVVWITFLNADGTVESESAIGAFAGGFGGDIVDDDQFGAGIAAIGDVNGDGVTDLAVGAPGDDDDDGGGGFNDDGAVYILFMNTDGTIQSSQKISDTAGGFTGGLSPFDRFGTSVTALGDLDGDAIPDIAVGAPGDVDPGEGSDVGAVWILLLNGDEGIEGTVKSQVKISAANPFLTGELEDFDRFGTSVTALGDLNDDGVVDLAVGAPGDDDGGPSRGAIYIVLLNVDGSVAAIQKISDTAGGLVSGLDDVDLFGASVAALGDLDGDGLPDVAVGAPLDDDAEAGGGGPLPDTNRGAVYIVLLNADGTVRGDRKVSDTIGEFDGVLADFDEFGAGLGAIGDLDGDGVTELAVGAPGDDDGGTNRGATWILFLDGDSPINFAEPQEFDAAGPPNVAAVGDLDSPIVQLPGFFGDLAAGGTLPADTEDVAVIIPNPAGGNGVVQIFLNEGTETDGTWREFEDPALTYFVGPDPSDITLGLFNGDGYLDIAVTNAGNDTVSILFNDANGMGTFTLEQTITGFQNPSAILAGEFLGVENALAVDLVVANEDADNIVFIENDGTGNFVQTEIPPVGVGIGPKAIDPLDIDNDTDEDVVVGNGASASVTIIVNEDDSDDFSVVAEVPTGEGPTDLATGDLDGDGDDDIVSSNSKDGTATVIKNNGSLFGDSEGAMFTPVLELLVGAEPLSVDMVDLDGDGDMDLALTATDLLEGPTVQVLESLQSEGAGLEFEPPTSVGVGADPVFISNGDFDGNGLSDIVTANEDPQGPNGGSVTVILGEPELPCPTDVNFDGVTDFGDILDLLGNWGGCTKHQPCPGDLNQDSYVNFADLLILLGGFGPC